MGFFPIATFALEQLARMSDGTAALSDLALTLRGRASDVANHIALANALRSPPSGARIAGGEIGPPIVSPYLWSIDKGAQGLVLRGAVPDAAKREANVAAARSVAGGAAVRDEQFIGDGAPSNYAANVAAATAAVVTLDEGRGEIRDAALALSGKAATQDALNAVRNALQAAGINVAAAEGVTAPQPARMPDPPEAPPLSPDLIATSHAGTCGCTDTDTGACGRARARSCQRSGAIVQGQGHDGRRRAHGAVQALAFGDCRRE